MNGLLPKLICFLYLPCLFAQDSIFEEEIPDLTPPIPVDVFHLIDQSGSVDERNYVDYLEFALNVSMSLGEKIGFESEKTPGIRVSVLGFGCKLYTSNDETDFLLLQENNQHVIQSKFDTIFDDLSYPGHSRTCLRYALKHAENAIISSSSGEALNPERKTVIFLYTDGQDGDFGWNKVSESPLFNNEEFIEVFAIGVSSKNIEKITNRIVRDESHVYSSTSQVVLHKVTDHLNDFLIDPFELKVSLLQYQKDFKRVTELDPSSVLDIPVGVKLGLKFPHLREIKDSLDSINENISLAEMKHASLLRYQTQDISTSERLDILDKMKNSNSTTDILSFWNKPYKKQSLIRTITETSVFVCAIQTLHGSNITLASLDDDGNFSCLIPPSIFAYDGYEKLLIQVYRSVNLENFDTSNLFTELIKSFSFQLKWFIDVWASDIIRTSDQNGCDESHTVVNFDGKTVSGVFERNDWSTEQSYCELEQHTMVVPTELNSAGKIGCIVDTNKLYFESFIETGDEPVSQSITLKFYEPHLEKYVESISEIPLMRPSFSSCIDSLPTKEICLGESFVSSFLVSTDLRLFELVNLDSEALYCTIKQTRSVAVLSNTSEGILVSCLFDSFSILDDEQVLLIMQPTSSSSSIILADGPGMSLKESEACVDQNVATINTTCEDSTARFEGQVVFEGPSIRSLLENEKEDKLICALIHFGNAQVVELVSKNGKIYCNIDSATEEDRIDLLYESALQRISSFAFNKLEFGCVNFQIYDSSLHEIKDEDCISEDMFVEISVSREHQVLFSLNCHWNLYNMDIISNIKFDEETNSFRCYLPSTVEVLLDEPAILSLHTATGLYTPEVYQLPQLSSCLTVLNYGLNDVYREDNDTENSWNCQQPILEVSFNISMLSAFASFDDLYCIGRGTSQQAIYIKPKISADILLCFSYFNDEVQGFDLAIRDEKGAEKILAEGKRTTSEPCITVDEIVETNCTGSTRYLFEGVTMESALLYTGESNWKCQFTLGELQFNPDFILIRNESFEHHSLSGGCKFAQAFFSGLNIHGDNPGMLSLSLVEDNSTIFEYSHMIRSNPRNYDCDDFAIEEEHELLSQNHLYNGIFGTSLMFVVGGCFAYSRKRKYPSSTYSVGSISSGRNSGCFDQDLVESITENEMFLFDSSGFDINDIVEVSLDTITSETCTKVGIIVNKRVVNMIMQFEVKLLDEDNVVITELTEADLSLLRFKVGESVLVLDEEVEDRWNESVIIACNMRIKSCDVRQGSNRLNDVPLVCVRRLVKQICDENCEEEIFVNVPLVNRSVRSVPRSLFSEPGILKKSNLKKFKTIPLIDSGATSADHKKVKFDIQTRIPPPKFLNSSVENHNLVPGKNFYDTGNECQFKIIKDNVFEISVDISQGLGVCWVFDRNDGSILVGKFVQTSNERQGPIEKTGYVNLKDRLMKVGQKEVSQNLSLSQVKKLIRDEKHKNKCVTFRFESRLPV